MAYQIEYTTRFSKSLKLCAKRGLDMAEFQKVADLLRETGTVPDEYHPHPLHGKYIGCWECHIQPNWLLVWKKNNKELILIFIDTGTHADLFGK